MRRFLWRDLLNNVGMYDSGFLVLHAVGSVIAVYAVCTVLDFLRIKLLEKPVFLFWDRHFEKCKNTYLRLEEKIFSKFNIK